MSDMAIFSKKELIEKLKEIKNRGWIKGTRAGNAGSIGNTLEDLLGIEENNLPIPNAAEWELKSHKITSNSLITLFHMEPSPTALKFVARVLLPKYGWSHKEAGVKHPKTEMSFRQTISHPNPSDRGFRVEVDESDKKVLISFDARGISDRHAEWLKDVRARAGVGQLDPQPYWGFNDLSCKAGTKLQNCFFVGASSKKTEDGEYFHYKSIMMLKGFSQERFIQAIKKGEVLIDFDARTGHNHGTKFRIKKNNLPNMYDSVTVIEE